MACTTIFSANQDAACARARSYQQAMWVATPNAHAGGWNKGNLNQPRGGDYYPINNSGNGTATVTRDLPPATGASVPVGQVPTRRLASSIRQFKPRA